MTARSDELVNELVSAAIAFGRGREPDWQTRIEDARVALCEYIAEADGLEEDSGSYDSLIPDWADVCIKWEYEDQLPEGIPDEIFSAMCACSELDIVRAYPYITIDGRKRFLIDLEASK